MFPARLPRRNPSTLPATSGLSTRLVIGSFLRIPQGRGDELEVRTAGRPVVRTVLVAVVHDAVRREPDTLERELADGRALDDVVRTRTARRGRGHGARRRPVRDGDEPVVSSGSMSSNSWPLDPSSSANTIVPQGSRVRVTRCEPAHDDGLGGTGLDVIAGLSWPPETVPTARVGDCRDTETGGQRVQLRPTRARAR